jgi:hypothetical protein
MTTLCRLLSLLLCFELIVGPLVPHLSVLQKAHATEPCDKGLERDPILNRCMTSDETALIMNATNACAPQDATCYKKNAEDALGREKDIKERKSKGLLRGATPYVSSVITAGAVAVPMAFATKSLARATGTCASIGFWSLVAGSAALFAGELISNIGHGSRLDDIQDEWEEMKEAEASADKDTARVNATNQQSQAFDLLIQSEESLVKAANMKRIFYGIAMLAYATALTVSILEVANPTSKVPCNIVTNNQINERQDLMRDLDTLRNAKLVAQAKDYASFQALISPGLNEFSSPSLEIYEQFKELEEPYLEKSDELLSIMKGFFGTIASNINPLPELYAEDDSTEKSRKERRKERKEERKQKKAEKDEEKAQKKAEKEQKKLDKAARSVEEKEKSYANTALWATITGGAAGAALGLIFAAKIKTWVLTGGGRIAFSSVLLAWSTIMFFHAGSQAKASKNRAVALTRVRDEFKDASGSLSTCVAADRSNPGKPECYCYTPEGQRNPSRGNSTVCQKLWTGRGGGAKNDSNDMRVTSCVSKEGQPDPKCNCRKNNTCLKAPAINMAGLNLGTNRMLSNNLQPINQLGSGNFDGASFNPDSMANQAMRLGKQATDLLNKKGNEALKKEVAKNAEGMEKAMINATSGIPAPSFASNSSLPSTPAAAAAALEKEINEAQAQINTASSGESLGQPGAPKQEGLDFGMNNEELTQGEQLAEVMSQDLDYGQNDINPAGANSNIFDVLSNRYQRSGMRRLFDESGKNEIDAANKTDISP